MPRHRVFVTTEDACRRWQLGKLQEARLHQCLKVAELERTCETAENWMTELPMGYKVGGSPAGWPIVENPMKMDDFRETPILGNLHMENCRWPNDFQ